MNSPPSSALVVSLALSMLGACRGAADTRHELEMIGSPMTSGATVEVASLPAPLVLSGSAYDAALLAELPAQQSVEGPGLYNMYWLSDSILSGSEPEGRASLAHLASLGVRTVLSVDGKAPEAELAASLGLRYVHVPIQYAGIEPEQQLAIAKVFRELPGPFYVHCFHGRHRGPAAAAIGRVVLDGAPRERALAEMRQWANTSGDYEGLYAVIACAQLPSARESADFDFDFPERQRFEGLRAVMVPLVRHWDELKAARLRGWELDPQHPDGSPAQEALILAGLYGALDELEDARATHADFTGALVNGRAAAQRMHELLRNGGVEDAPEALEAAYQELSASCRDCHRGHRNRR